MNGSAGGSSLQKIRTFADDVRRVRGDALPTTPDTTITPKPVVESTTPLQPLTSGSFRTLEDGGLDIRSDAREEATIVTEHSVQKWSFTQAVTESLKNWWADTIAEIKESQGSPKVSVKAARPEVVREAGRVSKLAPQDDHGSFLEKLRSAKAPTPPPIATPTPAPEVPVEQNGAWTHTTDESQSVPENNANAFISQTIAAAPTPPLAVPAPEVPFLHSTMDTPLPEPQKTIGTQFDLQPADSAQSPDSIPISSVQPDSKEAIEPTNIPSSPVGNEAAEQTPAQTAPRQSLFSRLTTRHKDTSEPVERTFRSASSAPAKVPEVDLQARYATPNRPRIYDEPLPDLPSRSSEFAARAREAALRRKEMERAERPSSPFIVYVGMGIVIIFILALVGALGYVITQSSDTTIATPGDIPLKNQTFFPVADSLPVVLSTDRTTLLDDLTKRVRETGGVPGSFIRYYFVYASDASDTAVPAQAFIDILRLRAPGTMLRTIEPAMMFGVYLGAPNAPFAVLKVKNYEDALGGMLEWESNLNSDLAPLFGEDIGAIGYTPVFVDRVLAGVDTRILKDADGNTLTIWGFVNQNTLVITTSEAAFGTLAASLK